ncbi:unnamed protein product [Thlaspi arvense]|uniref:Prolamin-like domain-containing protein n=1 Tax=Thlaspi arvense TaxID=13288 RepID=A0AAU9S597_THLAR|nr:unnamed protein product [Thlaspi arvense]
MAKSLFMIMFVSAIVIFFMSCPIHSQEIDQYSEELPEDVSISPSMDFDLYLESPDEAPIEADSPAMEYDMELAHRYSYKQLDFLQNCLQKMSSKCGDEIFKNMMDETAQILTNECCLDLLKLHKDCHLGLAQIIFSTYEFKDIASKAIPKSKQTWNDCARRVGSQIGVPVSLE